MDVQRLESETYRSRYSDGLIDVFFGGSLVWLGCCWIWFEDLAGIAGVLPAIALVPFLALRSSFVERRAGYVRFSQRRRLWERRTLIMVLAAGMAMFGLGIGAFVAFEGGGTPSDVIDGMGPGIIAALLAIMALVIAAMTQAGRFVAYGLILAVGGVLAAVFDTNPGVPVLVAGVVECVWGAALAIRFARSHPAPRSSTA